MRRLLISMMIGTVLLPMPSFGAMAVIDAAHISMQAGNWSSQLSRMLTQINNQIKQIDHMKTNLKMKNLTEIFKTVWWVDMVIDVLNDPDRAWSEVSDAITWKQGGVLDEYAKIFTEQILVAKTWEDMLVIKEDWHKVTDATVKHALINTSINEHVGRMSETLQKAMNTLNNAPGNIQGLRALGQVQAVVTSQLTHVETQLASMGRLQAVQEARYLGEQELNRQEFLRVHCPESPELRAMVEVPGCD